MSISFTPAPSRNVVPADAPPPPEQRKSPPRVPSWLAPFLLTPVVLLVHGYHPFANDAGIYIAGVRHILDPSLYPLNASFITAFTRLSLFPWAVAAIVRIAHAPLAWILLSIHLLSILLFLAACHQLATRLFSGRWAHRFSVLLAAACFTLPVAGTALSLMDPYLTARSFSTPLSLLALTASVDRAWLRVVLLLLLTALLHPLMAAFAVAFVLLHACISTGRLRLAFSLCGTAVIACGAAFVLAHRIPASPAYRQAILLPAHTFLFLARWQWYEILGLVLPLALFSAALRRCGRSSRIGTLCLTSLLAGSSSLLIAILFVPTAGPYLLVPLQLLRGFHLIYAVGLVLCGGALGTIFSRSRLLPIFILAAVFAAMFTAQKLSWDGRFIEWPGSAPANPWREAFLWIRHNTPRSAIFAYDPRLVYWPKEQEQGFRAIAERDHLADDKDAGIAAVTPRFADRWASQRNAASALDRMSDGERRSVLIPLGVGWILLPPAAATQLPCPFRNSVVRVCRLAP